MTKKIKIQFKIMFFVLILLSVSAALFSVSYARWVDKSGRQIKISGIVGAWKYGGENEGVTSIGQIQVKPLSGSTVTLLPETFEIQDGEGKMFSVFMNLSAGGSFELYVDGKKITFSLRDNTGLFIMNKDGSYQCSAAYEGCFHLTYNAYTQELWIN